MLAYLRHDETEIILCIANLCETAQATQLDLSEWNGRVPLEMFGGCRFPDIGAEPYTVTLPGHGFLWLKLLSEDEGETAECVPCEASRPDLPAPDRPLPTRPREREKDSRVVAEEEQVDHEGHEPG